MNTELRDRNCNLIGQIRDRGSRLELYDSRNDLQGCHNKDTNETRDKRGNLVGKGNLLLTLLSAN